MSGLPDLNRLQSRAPNWKTLYADVVATYPTTFLTVPANSEYIVHSWNIYYGGSDLGTETITLSVVNKAR